MPRKTPGQGSSGSSAGRRSDSAFSGGRPQAAYCARLEFVLAPDRFQSAACDVVFGIAVMNLLNTASYPPTATTPAFDRKITIVHSRKNKEIEYTNTKSRVYSNGPDVVR